MSFKACTTYFLQAFATLAAGRGEACVVYVPVIIHYVHSFKSVHWIALSMGFVVVNLTYDNMAVFTKHSWLKALVPRFNCINCVNCRICTQTDLRTSHASCRKTWYSKANPMSTKNASLQFKVHLFVWHCWCLHPALLCNTCHLSGARLLTSGQEKLSRLLDRTGEHAIEHVDHLSCLTFNFEINPDVSVFTRIWE